MFLLLFSFRTRRHGEGCAAGLNKTGETGGSATTKTKGCAFFFLTVADPCWRQREWVGGSVVRGASRLLEQGVRRVGSVLLTGRENPCRLLPLSFKSRYADYTASFCIMGK